MKVKYLVEYLLLRTGTLLLASIPYRVALAIGWLIAFKMHWILSFRVRATRQRLQAVFGTEKSDSEIRHIAWLAWRNFVFGMIDVVRLSAMTREWFMNNVDCSDVMPRLEDWRRSGTGMIVAAPHMGSWIMGGGGIALMGFPVFGIAGKQRNPLFARWTQRWQENTGFELLIRGNSPTLAALSRLQKGRILAIQPDVRVPQADLSVAFLGDTINMGSGMGVLAWYGKAPILPVYLLREGWTRHKICALPLVECDRSRTKSESVRQTSEQVMKRFEELIRRHPEQWFWCNSRWLLDPVVVDPPVDGVV